MADPTRFYPFTDVVDMSPDAIDRRIEEVFQLNKLCAWLGQAKPIEPSKSVAEPPGDYTAEENADG